MKPNLSNNQITIMDALMSVGSTNVAWIAAATGLTKAAVSANIKPLRDKGIISTEDAGGTLILSPTPEYKASRVDRAFDKAIEGAPAPAITAPTPAIKKLPGQVLIESISANLKPRELVLQLIKLSGMTKKAAKRVVYNHAYC